MRDGGREPDSNLTRYRGPANACGTLVKMSVRKTSVPLFVANCTTFGSVYVRRGGKAGKQVRDAEFTYYDSSFFSFFFSCSLHYAILSFMGSMMIERGHRSAEQAEQNAARN